ncbi:hypothetical protein E4U42_002372 [Claviceps africana]|uniref:N-acetyltransferase domain-containing protein n=1 Tax=Claviceps africana TaxID=83212 RepID=A0A8K0J8R2_9HYPO|nr:hypothetical protein E4U42_002372 [Claviceps africana]
MASTPTVRHARRKDAPVILDLIRGLALYEKEPDAVEATVETLLNTIAFAPDSPDSAAHAAVPDTEPITPHRPSRCLLAFDSSGRAVGMALYFYNYSTWRAKPGIYLEDLFVQPEDRGKGYGKRLLVELARQVVAMDGGRLDWAVLKWNEPSIRFYESIGATTLHEWVGMRVEGPGLDKLARLVD